MGGRLRPRGLHRAAHLRRRSPTASSHRLSLPARRLWLTQAASPKQSNIGPAAQPRRGAPHNRDLLPGGLCAGGVWRSSQGAATGSRSGSNSGSDRSRRPTRCRQPVAGAPVRDGDGLVAGTGCAREGLWVMVLRLMASMRLRDKDRNWAHCCCYSTRLRNTLPKEPPDEVADAQTERKCEQRCSRPVDGRVAQPRVAALPARNPLRNHHSQRLRCSGG